MNREEVAREVAVQAFNGLGYSPDRERLSYSCLAVAWATGFPKRAPVVGMEADNPWLSVSIQYHLEEAIMFRFWAMQAELVCGYISKIMQLSQEELGLPIHALALQPIEVLRGMTQLLLDRAGRRATLVGSPGTLSGNDVIATYNNRVLRYESLVSAAVQDKRPIPTTQLQLGLSREHPWTILLTYCAENLCASLELEPDVKPLATVVMELAVSQVQTGIFRAIAKLP